MNVVIIGVGQIGSRHLQAVANLKESTDIYAIDVMADNLEVAKQRFEQIENHRIHKINYCMDTSKIPMQIDVAIIATGSSRRREIIEKLLENNKVRYLILEKVLFQRLEDYDAVIKLVNQKHVKTFVNCPQRVYEGTKEIKKIIGDEQIEELNVLGSNWGLACNCVHVLDDFAFYNDSYEMEVSADYIENRAYDSKRAGYKEFFGTLIAKSEKGSVATITCCKEENIPYSWNVKTKTKNIYVVNANNEAIIYDKTSHTTRIIPFNIKYQSGLTNIYIEDLQKTGKCELSTLVDSAEIHKKIIKEFLKVLNKIGEEKDTCPIT